MNKLNIHYFQHAAFEGLGSIETWASQYSHSLTSTKFHEKVWFPDLKDIDWLIVMGGPMNVHDEDQYSWLKGEKQFIRQAIEAGKTVLGICLGSQLVSEVLGAKVYRNLEKEIGWFDIELTPYAKTGKLFFNMEDNLKVFHWHGDTFDLPENAIHLAGSEASKNQAYIYKEKVLAMQFHIETTMKSMRQMLENCRNDLTPGKYVQTENEILNSEQLMAENRKTLFTILDRLAQLK